VDDWKNLSVMFFEQATRRGDKPFLWKKQDGAFQATSWNQAATMAHEIAGGLLTHGIEAGDRVVLVSENRPEWLITEVAVLSIGAILVPAYTTNTIDDHAHILTDSGAKAAIVSTGKLAAPLLAAAEKSGDLSLLCHMEPLPEESELTLSLGKLMEDGRKQGTDIQAMAATWGRDQTACIIYTSGTGGLPKGVVLHHGAILHNCAAAEDALLEMGLDDEVFLSFLPLSHSYEHMAGQFFPVCVGAQIYYAEGIETLATNMAEAHPTIMTAVPRLYETMHARITRGVEKQGGLKEKLFYKAYALGVKRYHDPASLSILDRLMDRLVDKLVRDKVRARFGGRLKALVSGGAPLNPEIGLFFTALGLRILQGYGQTESAPVIAVNRPSGPKMHTVGPIVKDTEVKITPDGEILCRGELVMQGYWNNEDATSQAIQDGWLHTGDIGEFDADGHLLITDRKKDIIVNSGGDNIAPQRIEGILCMEPEIGQAMVYGDKRPNLVALIVPDEAWLVDWKKASGKSGDINSLKDDVDFKAAISGILDRINQPLSIIEKVRRYVLADEAFSVDNGEMTPTMKIKRHVLKTRYGDRLEGLYRS
jgi:long-chain acyl-CoA synthetase